MTSLEDLQRALAQSLVVAKHRRNIGMTAGADAPAIGDPALAGISKVELRRAGQTLIRKRLGHVRSLLPRTAAVLGHRLPAIFQSFASEYHFSGFRAPLQDGIGFSLFIAVHRELPPWVCELARWESMFCRCALSKTQFRMVCLRYRIFDPLVPIRCEEEPPKRHTLWLAYRLFGCGRIRRIV